MTEQTKNFAVSAVATAPSPATTGVSLVVASGEGTRFPTAPFNATVVPVDARPTPANSEVVRVTARSTDTFTIARAQESSTARSIVVGDIIRAAVTAKTLVELEAERVKVRRTTDDTTFATSTTRAIPFNSEIYDVTTDGGNDQHDNTTNPARLICRRAGVYRISFNMELDLTGGFGGSVKIRKNGTGTVFEDNGQKARWLGSADDLLAEDDYLEIFVSNTSGATRGVVVANVQPWFAMSRVGD
jgi:hypothetical protein